MKIVVWSLVLLVLAACSTKDTKVYGVEGVEYFPQGQYQQEVSVKVTVAVPPQFFDFNCLVQVAPKETIFVGYNEFGLSLFKIRDRAGEPLQVETSISQIEQHKDFFLKIFKLVKAIMALRRDDPSVVNNEVDLIQEEIHSHVIFKKIDAMGIPIQMQVMAKDQYEVNVKTTSYKPLKTEIDHH